MLKNRAINYFVNKNFEWWIDSGTLLGFVRENNLLKGDTDIDIGIKNVTEHQINEILSTDYFKDYVKVVYTYFGMVYKVKLLPRNLRDLKIDINIFFFDPISENYFSPQGIKKNSKKLSLKIKQKLIDIRKGNTIGSKKKYVTIIYRLISKTFKLIHKNRPVIMDMSKLEGKYYDIRYWIIPNKYLRQIIKYQKLPVPTEYKQYLTYRYQNWRVPNKKWIFTRDDGALKSLSHNKKDRLSNIIRGEMK
ncbi:hypothetical protein RJI07_09215 [Mycoplasmatota bacterium WC30]